MSVIASDDSGGHGKHYTWGGIPIAMKVTFLGTGGSIPSVNRSVSSAALQYGSDVLLFDCGEGTQRQLMMSSLSFMKIKRIFITHFHGDHFLGLPGLIQSMSFSGREDPLYIHGPAGMVELVNGIISLGYFAKGFEVWVGELDHGDTVKMDGYSVSAVRVDHSVPALGYVFQEDERPGRFLPGRAKGVGVPEGPLFSRLQRGHSVTVSGREVTPEMVMGPPRRGRKVVISGDTRPCQNLEEAARGADLLVHEATLDSSLADKAREFGHSTAEGAAGLAARAGVRSLFLNHISNRYEEPDLLEEEARQVFSGAVVAEDLMSVEVTVPD